MLHDYRIAVFYEYLHVIRENEPVTAYQLSKILGKALPTVMVYLEHLLMDELIKVDHVEPRGHMMVYYYVLTLRGEELHEVLIKGVDMFAEGTTGG